MAKVEWNESETHNTSHRKENPVTEHIEKHIKIDYNKDYAKNKYEPKRWKELLQSEIESGESYDDIVNNYNSKENTLEEKKKSPLYYLYKTKTEDIINEDPTSLNKQGLWFKEVEVAESKERYCFLFCNSTSSKRNGLKFGYRSSTPHYGITTAYFVANIERHKKTGELIDDEYRTIKRTKFSLENARKVLYGLRDQTNENSSSIKYLLCNNPKAYKYETNDEYTLASLKYEKVYDDNSNSIKFSSYNNSKTYEFETNDESILASLEYAKIYHDSIYAFIEYLMYLCAEETDDDAITKKVFENIYLRCKTKVFGGRKPKNTKLSDEMRSELSPLSVTIIDEPSNHAGFDNCFSEDQYSDLITAALVMTAQGNKQGLEWLKSGNNIHFSDTEDEFSTNSLFHFFEILYTLI